jgi:hypothetical protein
VLSLFVLVVIKRRLEEISNAISLSNDWTDVTGLFSKILKKGNQFKQFLIVLLEEPALNGNAVVNLVSERLRGIVDDYRSRQVPSENVQILYVIAVYKDAMLPEQTMTEISLMRVQEIQKLVGVDFFAGGE